MTDDYMKKYEEEYEKVYGVDAADYAQPAPVYHNY